MKKSVLIISYVPNYNRQGYDFAECMRNSGYDARLFQMDGVTDHGKGIVGIKCIKPHGIMHFMHMLRNFLMFISKTVFSKKDVVVCIGRPMLVLGGIYNLVFRSKLIWYSLEYAKLGWVDRFVYRKCVTGYIHVEENRMKAVFDQHGKKDNALVSYNMPSLHVMPVKGGALRKYLRENYREAAGKRLVIYAGSYQRYACLDRIIDASRRFDEDTRLIVMAYGLPQRLRSLSPKCIVVPAVEGAGFYDWLADADCALLPYEDETDFNVMNCSPQKLFDCYVVGVPYVASDRPIIRKVLRVYPSCGRTCKFTDADDILQKIKMVIPTKSDVAVEMHCLHLKEFNYNKLSNNLRGLVESV